MEKGGIQFADEQYSTNRDSGGRDSGKSQLTDWAKEPSVLTLQDDLQIAKPAHDLHVSKVKNWLNQRNVEGDAKPKTGPNQSSVQPRLIRRQNEWRYSALSEPFLSTPKMFSLEPVTFEDGPGTDQNELVLNWQFRTKINRVKFIDEYVRTTVDEGTCVIRLGWRRETEQVVTTVPVFTYYEDASPENIQAIEQGLALMEANPRGYDELPEDVKASVEYSAEKGFPCIAIQTGEEEVIEERFVKNQPTLDIVNYENLYLDPNAEGEIEKANFAILSFETSKAELLKDGRYKNLDQVNWSASSPSHDSDHASQNDETTQFKDEIRKRVVAYEYWGWFDVNGDDTLVPIVATWIGNTMIRMEENPFPDKELPFVVVPYMPLKKSLTGEPDAELLQENQAILGAVTRGMVDLLARSANGQKGFSKGLLDPVNRRRYDKGEDYDFNPAQNPQHSIIEHKYPEIPNSALTMLQLQNQDAESLSGVKAFSGGLSGEAYGDVAAGIRGMLDAAAKREMSILRRLAKGMEDIGRKIVRMNAVFLSEEETIRVTNEKFVTVRREDLAGDFDITVDISTAEVDEAKSQDLSFMLQTLGPNSDFSMVQMILAEIATLKRMPELAEKIKNFQPQPDPFDQKIKELEIAKLEAEIVEIQAEAMLKQAKAKEAYSKADLTDLDYVEQETGTKHARDMDKQGAQAAANQELEITKRLLAPKQEGESRNEKELDVAQAMATQQAFSV